MDKTFQLQQPSRFARLWTVKAKFESLAVGSKFTNKHGHTFRKLPDVWARGNSDGKAGRALLLKCAPGTASFGGRTPEQAENNLTVVIATTTNVNTK